MDTGISPNCVSIIQKNLRESNESLAIAFKIVLELGPCNARLAVVLESSETDKSIPAELVSIHSKLGSALVMRNLFLDNLWTVPSSICLPSSSHQGVYMTCPTLQILIFRVTNRSRNRWESGPSIMYLYKGVISKSAALVRIAKYSLSWVSSYWVAER